MDDAFYLPLGDDRWRATVHTTGPWDARFQHGGPPSALLGRAIEQCSPREDMLVARMTAESTPPGADGWVDGYLSAVEWRFTAGAFGQPGPATAWTRLRHPLVPGEPPSPLQRVLAVADSGNGISGDLDLTAWHFINPELTVHLHREAVGEWVCLEAQTALSPGGAGLATSVLSDLDGPVGVGAQSLLVAPR